MKPLALAAPVAVLLVACNPHRVTESPDAPVAVPASFSDGGDGPLPERWWEDFGDPALNDLVGLTLGGNLQLRAAWARLEQARAVARQAGAAKWPQLEATGNGSRRKVFNQFSTLDPTGMTASSFEIDTYSLSLAAGYELDVWKKISSQAKGAARDVAAFRNDAEAIAMSLAAEVAETWFDILAQRAQRKLIESQIELNQTVLELVELRFRGGLSSAVDVLQQRQQLIGTRAQLAQLDATEAVLGHRLAVLTGQPPLTQVTGSVATDLPVLPPLPGTGIPADLLNRRPDVRAARLRVAAADYRVAAAVADRFPALRIGASLDFQETSILDLFKTPLWAIFGSVTAALFDGGRRSAEVDRQKAVVEELLINYGQALLAAMAEVEGALVQEREQLRLIGDREEQVVVAGQNLAEARSRYQEGLSRAGFLTVLNALQAQQAAELNLLGARRQLLSFRVQLCRALGGAWTAGLADPRDDDNDKDKGVM